MPKFIAGAVMAIFGGTAAFASIPQEVEVPRLEVQPPDRRSPAARGAFFQNQQDEMPARRGTDRGAVRAGGCGAVLVSEIGL